MNAMRTSILAVLLTALAPVAYAQEIGPDQRYLLLATTETSTMQQELDEAASQGFRVVVGSPASGKEMALLLERVAQPPDIYTYQLLATTRTSTLEKELNKAASEGFRLLPSTMIAKDRILGPEEIVVVMEQGPNATKRYSYKLLATNRTATLQNELSEAEADGYVVAGMVSRGEHMVVLEKDSPGRE